MRKDFFFNHFDLLKLPTIGSDGNVQYALRIPSPHSNVPNYLFGADIEWILAGGSSSSNRKYSQRHNEKNYENGYVIKAAFGNNSGSMNNWSKGSNYNLVSGICFWAWRDISPVQDFDIHWIYFDNEL